MEVEEGLARVREGAEWVSGEVVLVGEFGVVFGFKTTLLGG